MRVTFIFGFILFSPLQLAILGLPLRGKSSRASTADLIDAGQKFQEQPNYVRSTGSQGSRNSISHLSPPVSPTTPTFSWRPKPWEKPHGLPSNDPGLTDGSLRMSASTPAFGTTSRQDTPGQLHSSTATAVNKSTVAQGRSRLAALGDSAKNFFKGVGKGLKKIIPKKRG